MIETRIDNSVIPFVAPKFSLGQKVSAEKVTGYIIGLQREKYSWSYLVAEGDPPNDECDEDWYQEHKLTAS
jgi:hypothetical protein